MKKEQSCSCKNTFQTSKILREANCIVCTNCKIVRVISLYHGQELYCHHGIAMSEVKYPKIVSFYYTPLTPMDGIVTEKLSEEYT